tara:strand:+ start:288 stop:542 length:255 start_codon:yes stop_codon:yes gene_type:complete
LAVQNIKTILVVIKKKMVDYILIGLVLTFILEITTIYYADKIMVMRDDEPFIRFSMLERLFVVVIWPAVVGIFLYVLFKKENHE